MLYSFGIPEVAIWIIHVIIGLVLLYTGYALLNHKPLGQFLALSLMFLGVLAIMYHSHLMYLNWNK